MRAVVLAAGASRRAAGCKALFTIEGQSYLERTVAKLRAAGAVDVVVVVALPWRDAIMGRITPDLWRTVENLEPERGMLGSLQVGLAALAHGPDPVVVSLVDHPEVAASTIAALARSARAEGPNAVVRPRFSGRHGHPVALGATVVRALREAAPSHGETLREALVRAGRLVSIEVEDAAVLDDLDQPPRPAAAP
jgi:CTP:molybdopterin cytidylyltransferase MocA